MNGGSSAMILTEGVTKVNNPRRPDEEVAVAGVSLHIGGGEAVALVGPSGSGKTSLLSLIGCMSRPTSGRVVVDGRDVAKLSEGVLTGVRRRYFGFIFQQYYLIPDLSAVENVLLPLYPTGMRFSEMDGRADEALARLGMAHARHRKVRQLSGGEQQRVAVARALVNDPPIVVADEPTAHLDRKRSEELLDQLQELGRSGKTVIIATHDPLVYEHRLIDRVVSIRDGRVENGHAS